MDQAPISPTPAPAEPISPQQTLSPRGFNPLLILFVIILLVLVGVGGIFLGKSLNTPQLSAQPTVISLPTQTLTPTPDETASWKTYTSKGFSFKYPNDWTVVEEQNSVTVIKDPAMTMVVGACPGYSFSVNPYNPNENYSIYSPVNKTTLFEKTIEFSDKTNSYGCRHIAYFLDTFPTETTKPDWVIGFTFKNSNRKEVLNKILSTFKFTSP